MAQEMTFSFRRQPQCEVTAGSFCFILFLFNLLENCNFVTQNIQVYALDFKQYFKCFFFYLNFLLYVGAIILKKNIFCLAFESVIEIWFSYFKILDYREIHFVLSDRGDKWTTAIKIVVVFIETNWKKKNFFFYSFEIKFCMYSIDNLHKHLFKQLKHNIGL